MGALKLIAVGVVALILALVAAGVWLYRFSGPSVEVRERDDTIVVTNAFLGEYYLGFSEVTVEEPTGEEVLHAVLNGGTLVDELEFGPGSQLAERLTKAGWTVSERAMTGFIPGQLYRVTLRGNNGFGYENLATRLIEIPLGREGRMPNKQLKLAVTPLACARVAPAA